MFVKDKFLVFVVSMLMFSTVFASISGAYSSDYDIASQINFDTGMCLTESEDLFAAQEIGADKASDITYIKWFAIRIETVTDGTRNGYLGLSETLSTERGDWFWEEEIISSYDYDGRNWFSFDVNQNVDLDNLYIIYELESAADRFVWWCGENNPWAGGKMYGYYDDGQYLGWHPDNQRDYTFVIYGSVGYDLTVDIVGGGSVTLDPPGGFYEDGTNVTLTATPDEGYCFDHWGSDASGENSEITITMDADKDVKAVFKRGTSHLKCTGDLEFSHKVRPGSEIQGSFYVENDGDSGSELDWLVGMCPIYTSFDPSCGYDLKPSDGKFKVTVTISVPNERLSYFESNIYVHNRADYSSLYCKVPISFSTSLFKSDANGEDGSVSIPFQDFLDNLKERFPVITPVVDNIIDRIEGIVEQVENSEDLFDPITDDDIDEEAETTNPAEPENNEEIIPEENPIEDEETNPIENEETTPIETPSEEENQPITTPTEPQQTQQPHIELYQSYSTNQDQEYWVTFNCQELNGDKWRWDFDNDGNWDTGNILTTWENIPNTEQIEHQYTEYLENDEESTTTMLTTTGTTGQETPDLIIKNVKVQIKKQNNNQIYQTTTKVYIYT